MKRYLENFILVAIVLVIIQTFLDDFSRVMYWSVNTRNILLILGFAFDVIFTLEFLVRSGAAFKSTKVTDYWLHRRGWVDFISSVPLLLLNSGPALYFLLFAGGSTELQIGVFSVAKIAKAVRITRILRLLRVMKIFGKIHNADSKMAQHHVAAITTTAVFTVILVVFTFSLISKSPAVRVDERTRYYKNILNSLKSRQSASFGVEQELLANIFRKDKFILSFSYNERELFNKVKSNFKQKYDSEDYARLKVSGYEILIGLKDLYAESAELNLKSFIIIVMLVLSFMLIYTRHFVQNISDIIFVLDKGFRKKDYNLQVKINMYHQDHEIYKFAKFYNEKYLPAKIRKNEKKLENAKHALSMQDLLRFKRDL